MLWSRARGWMGVDIGTYAVKLAQIERHGSGYALTEAVVVPRGEPWGDVEHLDVMPRDSSEELIAARTLGEGFAGRQVATTVPMAICQLRSMRVPEGPLADQRAAIAEELAANGGDLREFDFWRIDNQLEKNTVVQENVSVLSVDIQWAYRVARDHQRAGLTCHTLDAVPLALARAVGMCEQVDARLPVAVLDWGFTRATFCIVVGGKPLFVRCLRDCGFGEILQALRAELALSWEEARRVAHQYAVGPQSPRPGEESSGEDLLQTLVSEAVAGPLNQLVLELQRTLHYLQTHRAALMPRHLWLFGGGAAVQEIDAFLSRRVGLPAHVWNLGEATFRSSSAGEIPVVLLGPAIALSMLAWEETP